MKFDRNSLLLYAVTDRKWTSPQVSLYDQACAAIDGGVTQLREKQLDESDFLAQARLIGKLCRARRVPFIINDNVELALRCQADGVHIGQDGYGCTAGAQTHRRTDDSRRFGAQC